MDADREAHFRVRCWLMPVKRARWAARLCAALACAGCHSSANESGGGGGDAQDVDVNILPPVYDATVCVEEAGAFTCVGTSWAACPATAESYAACDDTVPTCVGCFQDAAYDCVCQATGQLTSDGGPVLAWSCLGTQYSCSGVQNRDAAPFPSPGDSSADDAGDADDALVGEIADAEDGDAPGPTP